MEIGQVYLWNGQTDSARYCFLRAARMSDGRPPILTRVTEAYQKLGHYSLEKEFIDSARVWFKNPVLLAGPMGDALAGQTDYAGATREYLAYMNEDSVAAEYGAGKIIALIQYPESAEKVIAVIGEALKQQVREPRLANVYAQALIEQDRYGEAFDFFRQRDSALSRSGSDLLYFMQECRRRGRNDYIVTAGSYFLEKYPSSGLAVPARFFLIDGLIGLGQYAEAEKLLDSLLPSTRTSDRAEALMKAGVLHKNYLNGPDTAETLLRSAIRMIPGSRFEIDARLELADLFIRQRRLDSAIAAYDTLLARDLPDEKAEKAAFLRAETFLFKGEYDQATESFRGLIRRYPRGMYVNDAIQVGMILDEALEEAPKQMDLLSQAEYFRYVGRADSLEYYLTKICRIDIPGLAPVAYLRLGDLWSGQNRFPEAIAAADSLVGKYPESYFAPFGLKLKADILWLDPQTKDQAAGIYRSLLEQYGTYPFAAEIRDRLRRPDLPSRS
ncbi:MAG: tetratricopeptide repeat protein, partial [candidate division Zixibacteria bacterium]|nr:tetratricopeptide repeat protein [candidate division Zixibacteria bacterium]